MVETVVARVPVQRYLVRVALRPAGWHPEIYQAILETTRAGIASTAQRTLGRFESVGISLHGETNESSASNQSDPEQLDRLAGTLPPDVTVTVLRDLLVGDWHTPENESEETPVGDAIVLGQQPIPEVHPLEDGAVARKILNAAVHLVRDADHGRKASKLPRARLMETSPGEATFVDLRFHLIEDSRGQPRPTIKGWNTLAPIVRKHCAALQPKQTSAAGGSRPRAPEIDALRLVNNLLDSLKDDRENPAPSELPEDLAAALDNVLTEVTDNARIRRARPVVGTERDQWDSLVRIASKASERVIVATSFLSEGNLPEYQERLAKVPRKVRILVLYGHSQNIPRHQIEAECQRFQHALRQERPNVWVLPTDRKTHAKVVVNDRGDCWLGSCNLFSCAPGSEVIEAGIEFQATWLATQILDHLESLSGETIRDGLEALRVALPKDPAHRLSDWAAESLRTLARRLRAPPSSWEDSPPVTPLLFEAEAILRSIAERPIAQLVSTEHHRELVLSLLGEADHRIMLLTDALKEHGLDAQIRNLIANRPSQLKRRHKRFTVQLGWGRQDAQAVQGNDPDIKAGKTVLRKLRQAVHESSKDSFTSVRRIVRQSAPSGSSRVWFLPHEQDGPFMIHAKAVATDDLHALVTSDSFLAYGSQGRPDDSTELGLLIESPRVSRLLRGEVEVAVPELHDPWDFNPWRACIATAAQDAADQGKETTSAGVALGRMLKRAENLGRKQQALDATRPATVSVDEGVKVFLDSCRRLGLIHVKSRSFEDARHRILRSNPRQFDALPLQVPPGNLVWEPENVKRPSPE